MAAGEQESPSSLWLPIIGMAGSVVLAMIKLLAGVIGHSYALIADAVESMTDIVSSVVVFSGIRIAARPADPKHPYGYGKAEPLAALVVALIVLGAGIGVAVQAVREIRLPHHAPEWWTLPVLVAVVAIKEGIFRFFHRFATRTGNSAILADAWHHRSDAITSIAAFIGISIALLGGPRYVTADEWAALFASAVIIWNAWRLAKTPIQELMDRQPVELVAEVRDVAAGVPRVADVEKIFARKIGATYWVDMHIEVDPHMTVHDAHALAHEVKDVIRDRVPHVHEVQIHIEPHGERPEADLRS